MQIQAGSTAGKRPYAILTVTETNTSVANNSSTLSYKLVLKRPSSISSSAKKNWSCTINGKKFSGSGSIGGSGDKTLLSGTTTVVHNNDGKKTITIACSVTLDINWSGSQLGTISASDNMTLSVIPRNSQVTLSKSTANIGDTITINTNSKSSSFDFNIWYKLDDREWVKIDTIKNTMTWTIPDSLIDEIINSSYGTITIESNCYNAGKKVGSSTAKIKAYVPESIIPTIDNVIIQEATQGLRAKFGAFIKSHSTLNVQISATGVRGSTIKSYTTTVEGISYSSNNVKTSVLKSFGKTDVIVTVKDSRGHSASQTLQIDVLDYKEKVISGFNVRRCTVTGEVDETGGVYAKIYFKYSVDPIANKNDSSYSLQYYDGYKWTDLVTSTGYAKEEIYVSQITFDADKDFDFRIALTDFFGTYYSYASITPTFTLFNFHADGKHFAVSGISDKPAMQFYDDVCLEKDRLMKSDGSFLNFSEIANAKDFEITNWIPVSLEPGISNYSSSYEAPGVRRYGKIVELAGILTNSKILENNVRIFTIPDGYRPNRRIVSVQQGSGSNRWAMEIYPTGEVELERYSNDATMHHNVPTGSWLCFTVTYTI